MELLWIPIAVVAALMQSVRTAAQKQVNAKLSTLMTTYVRSLFGLPLMLVYLLVVMRAEGAGAPDPTPAWLIYVFGAAAFQVIATFLLIVLFRMRNFAAGTMLTKTDVMMTAVIGSLFFSEAITLTGWAAIFLTLAGVIAISSGRGGVAWSWREAVFSAPTGVGLLTGLLFCFSYLSLREASIEIGEGGFLWRAAWTMVAVTVMQVAAVGVVIAVVEPASFRALGGVIGPCLFIGATSAAGSVGWFTSMTLQNASYVKAVGQVEVIFTLAISAFYFREHITKLELGGILVIVAGVLLFLF